jgi:hypothetical protein
MYAPAYIHYSVMQRSAIYSNTNTSQPIRHGAQLSMRLLSVFSIF